MLVRGRKKKQYQRTLLDTVLLGSALFLLLLLDALDALVEVVLGGGALLRLLALCITHSQSSIRI